MTNVSKISKKDPKRLKTLKSRYELIVEANQLNHYTQCGNPKSAKYFKVLLRLKQLIAMEELVRKAIDLKAKSKVRQGFLNPQNGLTLTDLYHLTNPNYAK